MGITMQVFKAVQKVIPGFPIDDIRKIFNPLHQWRCRITFVMFCSLIRERLIMKRIYLLFFLLLAQNVFAETIYLKDGRVIQGKILEKSDYAVTVRQGNSTQKYFNEQIQKVEYDEKPASAASPVVIDPYQFPDISPEKAKLIVKLIELNGTRGALESQFNQILAKASSEEAQKLKDVVNIQGILTNLVPVFDRYYSEEDLKGLIGFYESALGQKIIRVTPLLMKDTLQATLDYFKQKGNL